MWYTLGYANTFIGTPAHGGRAGNPGDWAPVSVRLYGTPLPDAPCQCRGAIDHHHGPPLALHRPDGAQRPAGLPAARARCIAAPLIATAHAVDQLPSWGLRVPAGAVASESTAVRHADEPGDARAGRRGQLRPGADAAAGQRRSDSCGPAPVGRGRAAGHALDSQAQSGLAPKKNGATGCARGPWLSHRGRGALATQSGGGGSPNPTHMAGQPQRPRTSCRSGPPRRMLPLPRRWPVMACGGGRGRSRRPRCGAAGSLGAP